MASTKRYVEVDLVTYSEVPWCCKWAVANMNAPYWRRSPDAAPERLRALAYRPLRAQRTCFHAQCWQLQATAGEVQGASIAGAK